MGHHGNACHFAESKASRHRNTGNDVASARCIDEGETLVSVAILSLRMVVARTVKPIVMDIVIDIVMDIVMVIVMVSVALLVFVSGGVITVIGAGDCGDVGGDDDMGGR